MNTDDECLFIFQCRINATTQYEEKEKEKEEEERQANEINIDGSHLFCTISFEYRPIESHRAAILIKCFYAPVHFSFFSLSYVLHYFISSNNRQLQSKTFVSWRE